jgi:hypothetical protein
VSGSLAFSAAIPSPGVLVDDPLKLTRALVECRHVQRRRNGEQRVIVVTGAAAHA